MRYSIEQKIIDNLLVFMLVMSTGGLLFVFNRNESYAIFFSFSRSDWSYDEEADKVYQQDVSTVTGHLTTDHVASIITQVSHFKRSEKANQKVESQDTVEHGAKSA